MQLQGKILLASAALIDSWFEEALIFITEHNQNGATGFVLNKVFPRKLNELEDFKHSAAIDLYHGGPVNNQHIYFLHNNPELLLGSAVTNEIHFGGDFHEAITLLTNGKISTADVKIFIGYCGWDANELESEIEEGSWTIIEAPNEIIFKTSNEIL